MIRDVNSFFKNEILFFTAARYLTYSLNFSRVILAAKILGPFYFGIWGFLNLLIQYLSYTQLGVQYSVNLELSVRNPDNVTKEKMVVSSAFFITTVIGLFLLLGGVVINLFDVDIFDEYRFTKYSLYIVILVILLQFQQLFFNIHRVYGKLYKIAFTELFVSISVLSVLLLYNRNDVIEALFITWIVSLFLCLCSFLVDSPIKIQVINFRDESWELLKVGFPLLLFNLSYYLIIISSTTVLSFFYSVEIMGYYTLSNSISNAILLGINSIVWVFFPSFLAQLKEGTSDQVVSETINKINKIYLTGVFALFILFLLISPLIYLFLPHFRPAEVSLNLLFVTQIILASNFAANTFTMARRKYMHLSLLSFISVIFVIAFSFVFAISGLPYHWIAFSTVIGAVAFSITTRLYLAKQLKNIQSRLFKVTSVKIAICVILAGNLLLIPHSYIFSVAGVLIYIIFNWQKLAELIQLVRQKLAKSGR